MNGPLMAKIGFGIVGFLLMTVLGIYLAGAIFMLLNKLDPSSAGLMTFAQYWHAYSDQPVPHHKLKVAAILAGLLAYGVPALLIYFANLENKKLFGDARWATLAEIREAGLMSDFGIIVGKLGNRYLMLANQLFVMIAAPTRSGKGVSIVIPNLLSFMDSAVVLDIKRENFEKTAGFRAKYGHEVFLFDPFSRTRQTHCYNPLSFISRNPNVRIGDIISIANILYPTPERADPMWSEQARNLFVGIVLTLCETPELPLTLGEVLRFSTYGGKTPREFLPKLIKTRIQQERPLSDACVDAFARFCRLPDETLGGIQSSFESPLLMWANPLVDAATSKSDFSFRDVRKKKMSVYIHMTVKQVTESPHLVNLMFSQLIHFNTEELPEQNPDLRYQCLLLMDEFTSMGRIQILAKGVGFIAGYNLRLMPIIQSKAQLVVTYGRDEAENFVTNHACLVWFAPQQLKDSREYSEILGYQTVKGESTSRQTSFSRGGSLSRSENDQKRALLLPQEVMKIGKKRQIVMMEHCSPILCDKITYYKDEKFKDRLLAPPDIPTLDLDLIEAKRRNSTRRIATSDIENGIDVSAISLDYTVPRELLAKDELSVDERQALTASMFSALEQQWAAIEQHAATSGGTIENDSDSDDSRSGDDEHHIAKRHDMIDLAALEG